MTNKNTILISLNCMLMHTVLPINKYTHCPVAKLLSSARSSSTALSYWNCVITLVGGWWGQSISHVVWWKNKKKSLNCMLMHTVLPINKYTLPSQVNFLQNQRYSDVIISSQTKTIHTLYIYLYNLIFGYRVIVILFLVTEFQFCRVLK